MSCSHKGNDENHAGRDDKNIKSIDVSKLSLAFQPKPNRSPTPPPQRSKTETFDKIPAINESLATTKPWKSDANYFNKVYISALALTKMTIHAKSGGSIEIMGMMTGKIIEKGIIVMDVYALPVEGTETRVNAQAEGYEFMVRYLEANKKLGRSENIVGWYHSHPGYGCWLSGIDVGTQSLNQTFQDPYLAVVIDPIKTIKQNKVEIGAFRTYQKDHVEKNKNVSSGNTKDVPKSKRKDFGIHSDQYYSLDIEIFNNTIDSKFISLMSESEGTNSVTWLNSLLASEGELTGIKSLSIGNSPVKKRLINSYELQNSDNMVKILKLVELLQSWKVLPLSLKKLDLTFEDVIYKKLLQGPTKSTDKLRRGMPFDSSEDDDIDAYDEDSQMVDAPPTFDIEIHANDDSDKDEDESNLDEPEGKISRALDVSDFDDAVSMESSSVYKNDEEASVGSDSVSASIDDADLEASDEDRPHPLSMKRNRVDHHVRRGPRYAESTLLLTKQLTRSEKLSREVAAAVVNSDITPILHNPYINTFPVLSDGGRTKGKGGHHFAGSRPPKLLHNFVPGHDVEKLMRIGSSVGEAEYQELLTIEMQDRIFF